MENQDGAEITPPGRLNSLDDMPIEEYLAKQMERTRRKEEEEDGEPEMEEQPEDSARRDIVDIKKSQLQQQQHHLQHAEKLLLKSGTLTMPTTSLGHRSSGGGGSVVLEAPELTTLRLQPRVGAMRVPGIQGTAEHEDENYDSALFSQQQEHLDPTELEPSTSLVVQDAQAIVVAEKEDEQKARRVRCIYILVGLSLAAIIVGISTGVTVFLLGRQSPTEDSAPTSSSPSMSPSLPNLALTIAEYMLASELRGRDFRAITSSMTLSGALTLLNQTDRTFTLFGPPESAMSKLEPKFVQKILNNVWAGHLRDIHLNHILPGILYTEDMYDGMVVRTLAGGDLTIRTTPQLVIQEKPVFEDTLNVTVSNGVLHAVQFAVDGSWTGKSMYNVVVEANERRGGDLSVFLSILNQTGNATEWSRRILRYSGGPQTLFCPTDSAFQILSTDLVRNAQTTGVISGSPMDKLLSHHMTATTNFVRTVWPETLLAFVVDTDQAIVDSLNYDPIFITVRDKNATIVNENATVVEEDLLSEFGVVHVIDKEFCAGISVRDVIHKTFNQVAEGKGMKQRDHLQEEQTDSSVELVDGIPIEDFLLKQLSAASTAQARREDHHKGREREGRTRKALRHGSDRLNRFDSDSPMNTGKWDTENIKDYEASDGELSPKNIEDFLLKHMDAASAARAEALDGFVDTTRKRTAKACRDLDSLKAACIPADVFGDETDVGPQTESGKKQQKQAHSSKASKKSGFRRFSRLPQARPVQSERNSIVLVLGKNDHQRTYRICLILTISLIVLILSSVAVALVVIALKHSPSEDLQESATAATLAPSSALTIREFMHQRLRKFGGLTLIINFTKFTGFEQQDVLSTVLLPSLAITGTIEWTRKYLLEAWVGHTRSILRQHVITDQVIFLADFTNGTQVVSSNNESLTLRAGPYGVDNALITDIRDAYQVDGVIHTIDVFLTVSWQGKAMHQVLEKTNMRRGGDLSVFISLLDAMDPISLLRRRLWLDPSTAQPQTLFVPTNTAFQVIDTEYLSNTSASGGIEPGSSLEHVLENHLLPNANFVRDAFEVIFGTKHTQLLLSSAAGETLTLSIGSDVTINGRVRIVEEDVLCENGVIHVVDSLLLPQT